MNARTLVRDIVSDLKKQVDPVYREGSRRFFKHKIKNLGVRTGIVQKIGREHFNQIKNLSKKEIFAYSEALLKTEYDECATIAFAWIVSQKNNFTKSDLGFFKKIIADHVTSWARCDDFCTHTVGELIFMYPDLAEEIKKWTRSNNLWFRRASAVSFIRPAQKGLHEKTIFEITSTLLEDKEDMVQKGYGWLLKDLSLTKPAKVFRFVMNNKQKMPRTALRYAIERFPSEMRVEAMK